jgi:hypothetical protein
VVPSIEHRSWLSRQSFLVVAVVAATAAVVVELAVEPVAVVELVVEPVEAVAAVETFALAPACVVVVQFLGLELALVVANDAVLFALEPEPGPVAAAVVGCNSAPIVEPLITRVTAPVADAATLRSAPTILHFFSRGIAACWSVVDIFQDV